MIAYLDASVVLRAVLGERGRLTEWSAISTGVSSFLAEVECLRTLDRLHRQEAIDAAELAERRAAVYRLLEGIELVEVTRPVLRRASEAFPTPLGTLDAIHLSTALLWTAERGAPLVMATHDSQLGLAARASGFQVIGI